ncbi:MAG TPA: PilC/PilY family type IV pilus protein [Noviherbaspirillum sp.]|uniref:pilus assembly protein n=1 Tax=Noviherbaspirillum sp. TaxID=1926288 RepID=UPI002D721A53|nr:PilC/PilY family type IV pilus protein [Noviherbaspirillum sp.]HYD97323.1 PilC/PilY family type IV pilus protein [Noviherbaspirillum sp.]
MHRHFHRFLARPAGAALILLAAFQAAGAVTDISDTPMAVKNNVAPNFMYMIDNSGSMSNIVPDEPYSAKTIYLACGQDKFVEQGFSDPNNPPSSPSYDILIRSDGKPRFKKGSTIYSFGTGNGQACFNPAGYYNFRLLADSSSTSSATCGPGNAPCKHPGTGYLDAVYSGNYLNWYFGAAPGYSSAGTLDYAAGRKSGTRTRLEIAKSSTIAVLESIPLKTGTGKAKARVGLTTYNGADGGALLKNVADLDASHLAGLRTSVNSLTSSGSTPLSETLADIGHYFTLPYTGNLKLHPDDKTPAAASVANVFRQGAATPHRLNTTLSGAATSPIQYWCQRSYAILMTDGRPQSDQALSSNQYLCDYDGDSNGCTTSGAKAYDKKTGNAATSHPGHEGGTHSYESEGSDYLNDVALALYETDLRPDLAAPAGRTKKNNIRTYTVGFADDQAKNDPLLKETATRGGGIAEVAGNEAELVAAFNKAMNDAFAKDGAAAAVAVVNTQLTVDNTAYASSYNSGYWTGDLRAYTINTSTGLPNAAPTWSAQERMDAVRSPASSRKIATFNGSAGTPFLPSNVTLTASYNAELINYLRGDKSNEEGKAGQQQRPVFRKRKNLLGDVINAEPLVEKYSDGTVVVFQAANDGMMHAFNGSGDELWAYVPKMVWGHLKNADGGLADPNYTHRYMVDATPAVVTIANGTKLLVGGLGKGGNGYYALDVTSYAAADDSAAAAKVKWEFPASAPSVASSVGYTYGTPLIVNSPGGWVVLVPSGYNNSDGSGKVFVLDPLTGAVMQTISTGAGSASDPAGLAYLAKPGSAAATDVISHVWGGDLKGNVWRFDLSNWSATRIAVLRDGSGNPQPVSTAPVVGRALGGSGKYFVYVGTGLYLGDSDVPGNTPANAFSTQTQSMYGIIDNTANAAPALPDIRGTNGASCPGNGGDGAFVCQGFSVAGNGYTASHNTLSSSRSGWYFDLPIANARVVTHPQLTAGDALVFTANIPTNQTCDPGGSSYFVNVDARNGGAVETSYGSSRYHQTISLVGYALASRPVVVQAANEKHGVIRLSDQSFSSPVIHEPPRPAGSPVRWKRISWRELM